MPGAAFAIPVDGAITFAGFTDDYVEAAPAYYTLAANGSILKTTDTTGSVKWVRNAAPTNYECRATVTSGTLTAGTSGSWLDFSTDRTWSKTGGTVIFTLEIRDKYSLAVMKSVTITLVGV